MDRWILSLLKDTYSERGGILFIEQVSSLDIAEKFGTPVYVTSESRIRENFRRLYNSFGRLTRFRLFYAIKANSNLAILRVLKQEGAWADCSCPAEIYEAMLAGFDREKMLYTGNYNSREELQYAIDAGITINLDDASLLDKLPSTARLNAICFRINPGRGKGGKEGLVFAGPDAKFGSSEDVAIKGYEKAKSIGIKRFGIHMMTGSNVLDPKYFSSITETLMDIAGRISKAVGIEFEFVNIGGGFGIPYAKNERSLPIEDVAKSVVDIFKAKVDEHHLGSPTLAAEPGRYLVADSTVLLARVCHVKRTAEPFVGIDAGMNTLLRPALYRAYHPVLVANRLNEEDVEQVNICGQICENTDIIARDRYMPGINEGDIIAIFNAGAYGFSMSSQYNNRPRAAEVIVYRDQAELIRRRESIQDLLAGQQIPARLLT